MMTGLTIQQYAEIIMFVQKHHAFGGVHQEDRIVKSENNLTTEQYNIKYIDSTYDSRTQTVWSVSFRGFVNLQFRTNHFMSHDKKPDDFKFIALYDWIMAFLKGEWKPSEYMEKRMYVNNK